jgi:Beta-lactamase
LRPAGSINASAKDMAAYVQFYLNRGAVNGSQIVPAADIDRMESPASTWAAKDGLKYGYGLSNYWSVRKGFVYHGHDGGVEGGLTEMAYMPEYGVGYFYSTNTGNQDAFDKMGKAIRGYVTRNLVRPTLPPEAPLLSHASDYAGWYEMDASRIEVTHFLDRLAVLAWIHFKNGKLLLSYLGGLNDTFVPVTGTQFRHVSHKKGALPDPVADVELLTPNEEGRFVEAGVTLKKIPTWFAIGEILIVFYAVLCMLSVLVYAPFWMIGGLIKRRRRVAERGMRVWPLVAVLSLVGSVSIIVVSVNDLIERFGSVTPWSASLFFLTIAFAVASVAAAISLWRVPVEGVRRGVRWFSVAITVGLLIATAYLAYWGIIGLRTWA